MLILKKKKKKKKEEKEEEDEEEEKHLLSNERPPMGININLINNIYILILETKCHQCK